MWFKVEETRSEDQVQHALKNALRDGVASQAMGILTDGASPVAFAVKLGDKDRGERSYRNETKFRKV